MRTKKNEHVAKEVYPGSTAEEMEVEPEDILVSISNEVIEDVFDYRYLTKGEYIEVVIRKPDGEKQLLEIDKGHDDNLGMESENGLMSGYRSCNNECIFCFINQVPSGIRETLHFEDDDSRFPFLRGNYITLTNMKEGDIERVVRMQLAPINISVQTTNPQLRCKMLYNRSASDKLKYLQMLYEDHVETNDQMVCCRDVGDRAELKGTVEDLFKCLPFLRNVSVVPVGITKFRNGLFPIKLYTEEKADAVVDIMESRQQKFYNQYGLHFIHASDEWYITAGRDFPEEERYDGYIQLKNDVGMMRIFINEFNEALEDVVGAREYKGLVETVSRTLTIATGRLVYSTICSFTEQLTTAFPRLAVHVYFIRNDFFEETITMSDPITGQDLIRQLKEWQDAGEGLGEVSQIPSNMLRVGEQVSLDDLTVQGVEWELGMKMVVVESGGREFTNAILDPEYRMERKNNNFVYIRAYDQDKETQ